MIDDKRLAELAELLAAAGRDPVELLAAELDQAGRILPSGDQGKTRLDQAGRDVTDTPGLWDESDIEMPFAPVYQKDGVTLYHADALDVLPYLRGLGALVTDPPYSSGGQYRGDRTQATVDKYVQTGTLAYRPDFAGDNRDQRSFLAWCMLWINAARVASVPGSPALIFTDWRQLPTMTDAIQAGGYVWRNIATWWKPGVRMQKGRFSSSAEYIVYGTNGPAAEGMKAVQNVGKFSSSNVKARKHIAEKPLDVLRWILSVVPDGATVVDPFFGSGSTLVAAKLAGLPCIGIECDKRYVDHAKRRLDDTPRPLFLG